MSEGAGRLADLEFTKGLAMSGLSPESITSALRDANQVAQLLPVVEQQVENVTLSSSS